MKHLTRKSFLSGATTIAILIVSVIIFAPRNVFAAVLMQQSDTSAVSEDYGSTRGGYNNTNQFGGMYYYPADGTIDSATTTYLTLYFSPGSYITNGCPTYASGGSGSLQIYDIDTAETVSYSINTATSTLNGGCQFTSSGGSGVITSPDYLNFDFPFLDIANYTSFYVNYLGAPGSGAYVQGRNSSGQPPGGPNGAYDTQIASIAFAVCDTSPCDLDSVPTDTSTHIISVLPETGTTTATSSFSLGADIYVNPSDFVSGMKLHVHVKSAQLGEANALYNIISPVSGIINPLLFINSDSGTWDFDIATSGLSSFATTTGVNYIGRYDAVYSIQAPGQTSVIPSLLSQITLLGFSPFSFFYNTDRTLDVESSYFIASSLTSIDANYNYVVQKVSDVISNTASTTEDLLDSCATISKFSFVNCLTVLFYPSGAQFQSFASSTMNGFLSRAPIGYVSRIAEIVSSDATSSLPCLPTSLANKIVKALPGMSSVELGAEDLCFEGNLMGPGSLLASMHSYGDDPKTLWEIMETPWTWLWRFALIIYILWRLKVLPDFRNKKKFQEMSGDKDVSDDSYRLKEKLYEMSQRKKS